MSKKSKLSQEDKALFESSLGSIEPIKTRNKKIELYKNQPIAKKLTHPALKNHAAQFPTVDFAYLDHRPNTLHSETKIQYKDVSLSQKILRKLSKGQYTIDAKLDLHGMTVDEAFITLQQFITTCIAHQARVILIIHGKGRGTDPPILKNKVNGWLSTCNEVLAYTSAQPQHGGTGAVYVLLKRVANT